MKKITLLLVLIIVVLASCSMPEKQLEPIGNVTANSIKNSTAAPPSLSDADINTNSETEEAFDPEKLGYKDFFEDYNYFWDTIKNNYPFYNAAKRFGIDLESIHKEGRDRINGTMTLAEFAELMNKTISKFDGAGHMTFIYPSRVYTSYRNLYTGLYDKTQTSHTNYLANILNSVKTVNSYKYLDPDESTITPDSSRKNNEPAPIPNNFTANILEENNVAYVKINSFKINNVDFDLQKLQPFYKSVENYPNIIIDIRGNGGGSDSYWNKNIMQPLLGKSVMLESVLLFNNTEHIRKYIDADKLFELSVPLNNFRKLPNLNQEDKAKLTHACVIKSEIKKQDIQSNFKGKVWLLVDKHVYSSSESFTLACKSTGFATIVGTNTGGNGGGIDSMIFALPNTGLVWRNSIFYSINPDGSSNEEFGTSPDIRINKNEDALTVCLKKISEQ